MPFYTCTIWATNFELWPVNMEASMIFYNVFLEDHIEDRSTQFECLGGGRSWQWTYMEKMICQWTLLPTPADTQACLF